MILSIDTFSSVCGVSLVDKGVAVGTIQLNLPNAHSEILLSLIDILLTETKTNKTSLEAVCVVSGPGSFTGLRIGVSVAKGLCFGLDIPLISVTTFEAWCESVLKLANLTEKNEIGFLVDARQGDFYGAVLKNGFLSEIKTDIFENWMRENKKITHWFIETEKELTDEKRQFYFLKEQYGYWNLSLSAALLAEKKWAEGLVESQHDFEPLYIKDFIVKKKKES